jgi:hypothetical protein
VPLRCHRRRISGYVPLPPSIALAAVERAVAVPVRLARSASVRGVLLLWQGGKARCAGRTVKATGENVDFMEKSKSFFESPRSHQVFRAAVAGRVRMIGIASSQTWWTGTSPSWNCIACNARGSESEFAFFFAVGHAGLVEVACPCARISCFL